MCKTLIKAFAFAGLCSVWSMSAIAADYYVDSVNGQDSNSGLAENTAIQSVARANSIALAPGDSILFRKAQAFSGILDISESGSAQAPITVGAWGNGDDPILFEIRLSGSNLLLENLVVDHQKAASDAIRLRNCTSCTIRNLVARFGTRDAIDADASNGLLIENVEIHHFLNGSFGSEDDSHGVVATNTNGLTIRNANIHHVSGDSFQSDPNRTPGGISDNIVIEDSILWTGPLQQDFNSGWRAGDSPGENAIDTKVLKTGYENEIRMSITLTNVTAYGWTAVPEIPNRAAFNLKEKIRAQIDRVTVHDSEIAFRIRGALGNADTTITNTVIYDVEKAVRAEDNVANVNIHNTTFGANVSEQLELAGGSGGTGSWDWRNNAFLNAKPSNATDSSNIIAAASDFIDIGQDDYRLTAISSLIDQGVELSDVNVDRDGKTRTAPYDVGAYEFADSDPAPRPNPPVLTIEP